VRQKVLGANIHETKGLLEQNIVLPHAQWQGKKMQARNIKESPTVGNCAPL